jgi:hypothetical protein
VPSGSVAERSATVVPEGSSSSMVTGPAGATTGASSMFVTLTPTLSEVVLVPSEASMSRV